MRLTTLTPALLIAPATTYSFPPTPFPTWPWTAQQPHCVTSTFANLTFTRIRSILALQPTDLGNGSQTLTQILAANFESTSDSYSMLAGRLGEVGKVGTIDKKGEVEEVEGARRGQAQGGIETLALGTVGCWGLFWFWNLTTLGGEGVRYPVRGMHYLVVNEDWKITELHTEVNSLAYAADLGFKIDYPNGTVLPSGKPSS